MTGWMRGSTAVLLAAAAAMGTGCGSDRSADAPAGTTARAAVATGPAVERYRAYAMRQADLMVVRTDAFAAEVIAGRTAAAKAMFATAREPWERIEPIAETVGGLDPAIDAREGDVPAAEWTGFHRIERALWVEGGTAGMAPVARRLRRDVRRARAAVRDAALTPVSIAQGAKGLLDEVAATKVTGEENRYARTDLWDIAANLEGSRRAYTALRPLLAASDPALSDEIATRFAAVERELARHRSRGGYVTFDRLSQRDTRALARLVDDLAEPVGAMAAAVPG